MNDLHCLYTNGQDVLRIVKYVHPTPSIDGHFILARDNKGCTVTLQEMLKDWKVFNSAAAFADYLLYTDEHLSNVNLKNPDLADTHRQLSGILDILDQEVNYDEEGNARRQGMACI